MAKNIFGRLYCIGGCLLGCRAAAAQRRGDAADAAASWMKAAGIDFQRDGSRHLRFQPENPKKVTSQAWERYEKYKSARTLGEFYQLASTFDKGKNVRADFQNDLAKGFVSFVDPAKGAVEPTQGAAPQETPKEGQSASPAQPAQPAPAEPAQPEPSATQTATPPVALRDPAPAEAPAGPARDQGPPAGPAPRSPEVRLVDVAEPAPAPKAATGDDQSLFSLLAAGKGEEKRKVSQPKTTLDTRKPVEQGPPQRKSALKRKTPTQTQSIEKLPQQGRAMGVELVRDVVLDFVEGQADSEAIPAKTKMPAASHISPSEPIMHTNRRNFETQQHFVT